MRRTPFALEVEDLNAVVGAVCDVDAVRCDLDAGGVGEEAGRPTPISPTQEMFAFRREDLDAVVQGFDDV